MSTYEPGRVLYLTREVNGFSRILFEGEVVTVHTIAPSGAYIVKTEDDSYALVREVDLEPIPESIEIVSEILPDYPV